MNAIKRLTIILICFLTACAPPSPSEEPPANREIPLEERKAETATVSSWEIKGALAAKTKAKGWSATMNWVQQGANSYQIRLMGPLGGGAVLISKKGNTITFQDGAKITTSTNADELLLKQTGIRLPVNNLYYWVRGLPAPGGIQSEKHDQFNHLIQLKQNGYTIDFTKYTSVKGIDLPSMIRLEGNGVMVKVVIKNWVV
ncbi:TPA: outer membrane lipoprotein LolB [Legionella pneumophila subsp. pneumophila]|nr:outer membrane lipoprotein LolB [Legionella pneumophila subsp. pneumophila]HAT9232998.1 outer membrane lipoprotein LolB [Legionella pneumophila subsp. pneumophila]HAT9270655.1 outer membrane lipoprotein LolB [Legionella pneumophila subsp. pneumophila]HAT9442015.1 outer membrane lipoprotein LolB [Legionella pneumophila subsp. pneumophila]HAT9461235.1 outer membrane lipoprotein LolB [Legionella pneumophila subsp. pneumophila]